MNMDPRSDVLNTEMGIVIESPELAAQLQGWMRTDLPRQAWRVTLAGLERTPRDAGGAMQWIARDAGTEVVEGRREPRASLARRLVVSLLRWLPIDRGSGRRVPHPVRRRSAGWRAARGRCCPPRSAAVRRRRWRTCPGTTETMPPPTPVLDGSPALNIQAPDSS
jgi:hypothetical protein